MKKVAVLFLLVLSLNAQNPYGFFWNHSYNSNGTQKITINLTLETHIPKDEKVTIEFWKSGAENSPHEKRTVPWYEGGASGRSHAIMTKVGANQWQAIVDLDTTLVSANATSQSLYHYFYGRNTGNSENKNIEYSRTGDISNTRKLDFGWHTRASLVQEDTLTAWFAWPTDGVMPTIDTSTYLSAPPSDINTTTFMAGGGMNDYWRGYWNPFIGNYLDNMVRDLDANWIMLVPGPKIIQHHPTVTVIRDHDINSMPEQDIKKVITEAHKRGLKVFWYSLQPGLNEGNYDNSKVDAAWYVDYANAMRPEIIWQATLAETYGVELIGFQPFPTSGLKNEYLATIDSIAALILTEVRAIYSGKITMLYINETPELEIYGKVDYLNYSLNTYGLQYEGLSDTTNPSVSELLLPMRNKVGKLKSAYTKYGKPFVFSFIQSASHTGMLTSSEPKVEANEEYLPDNTNYPLNFQVQADGTEAMQQVIAESDWITGAFYFNYKVWAVNWKTWNIRGKPSQKVAAKWWRWHTPNNVHLTTSINDEATVKPFHKGGTLSLASGSYVLSKDTTVTVTASADDGYGFVKWTGDASGTSPTVTVSMDTDKAISAIFEIVNQSPVVAALSDTTMKEDESITVRLSATDEEGDAITFSAVSDTNAVNVSVSSATLTLTPVTDWNGMATITAYASDSYSKGLTSFKLTVTPVNDTPTVFEWVSSALDTVNITQSNLAETYTLQWGASTDVDGDSINYLVYAKIGVYPAEEVFDTTSTSAPITYQELVENVFEPFPMLPRVTVKITVVATDGIDTVKVTGDDRVLFVNRYEFLSTEGEGIPTEFALHENYPNPFNPTTTLRFDLPDISDVNLTIYNMLGQQVRKFNMNDTPAGYHSVTWDATNDLGQQVGAGVYLYQLQTKDFVKTRKMVLLK
jgi:hypothetical protein